MYSNILDFLSRDRIFITISSQVKLYLASNYRIILGVIACNFQFGVKLEFIRLHFDILSEYSHENTLSRSPLQHRPIELF